VLDSANKTAEAQEAIARTALGLRGPWGADEALPFSDEPVTLVEPDALSALGEAARARGYLWIQLDAPGPAHRGRLGLYIEETIESALEDRGALSPGVVASTGLDASVSDQLYRARLIEMRGLALGIPSLEGITNLGRTLDADDSSVLRWWMAAASDRPIRLVISKDNTRLRAYQAPVFFEALFELSPAPLSPRAPSVEMAESSASMDLSDLPPAVALDSEVTPAQVTPAQVDLSGATAQASARRADDSVTDVEDDYVLAERRVTLVDLDRALGLPATPDLAQAPEAVSATESETTLAREEPVMLPAVDLPAAEPVVRHQQPPSEHASDDLDSDEFLRTLAEDSAKAPPVQAEDVPAIAADSGNARDGAFAEDIAAQSELDTAPADESAARLGEITADSEDTAASEKTAASESTAQSDVSTEAAAVSAAPLTDERTATASLDAVPSQDATSERPLPSEVKLESAAARALSTAGAVSELPTKTIARKPFIRFATASETVHQAPLEDQVALDQPVALKPQDAGEPASPVHALDTVDAPDAVADEPRAPRAELDPEDPFNQLAARKWQSWVSNLVAARGPKPLSVIERMFVTDYTRLREAVRRGVADQSANVVLDEWRDAFTSSYGEAYDALRVRGKRPTMVLDLPELAKRLGRLQGAKRVQLFLVDGMRFDLGIMIQERLRKCAAAALTERLLLWSALPSVTSHQLELLGRGPDGLKDRPVLDESPALVARGRAALTPRRVRTGALEILKLDVVEDMLRQPGSPVLERLDSIADAAAEAIAGHIEKLPERTMVVVFGDHGFALDPHAAGTTEEVKQGGASPEEVLVPAFAWLTGATH